MKEMVRDVLHGENRLLYTYGVTNSGKTYTIQGNAGARIAWNEHHDCTLDMMMGVDGSVLVSVMCVCVCLSLCRVCWWSWSPPSCFGLFLHYTGRTALPSFWPEARSQAGGPPTRWHRGPWRGGQTPCSAARGTCPQGGRSDTSNARRINCLFFFVCNYSGVCVLSQIQCLVYLAKYKVSVL